MSRIFSTLALLSALCYGVDASTLTPPVLPLIVRNPYLSTWLANAREEPWKQWPIFWTKQEVGFGILASVPATGQVYPLLGRPQDALSEDDDGYALVYPTYLGAQFDASTTNLSYSIPHPSHAAGHQNDLEIVLSFLSPITPSSTLRQSIPASYLTVQVTGNFDIDIYVDLNGLWVSGDRGSRIKWELNHQSQGNDGDKRNLLKTWKVQRETQQRFTEYNDRAEWGTLYFSGPTDVRHESGTSARLRQRFSRTGTLENTVDDSFRSIMDEEPVFAFSKSFTLKGNTSTACKTQETVRFTLAHVRDPVVKFASARGMTEMRPLWASWFHTDEALLTFHYLDYKHAFALAANYSRQVDADARESGSENYADIVALTARQVLGGTDFSGTPDNPILFVKEISSDGNSQTIDIIYPMFPFFLYTNPRWLAYQLEPLIEHMLSGQYPNKYAMHDLGAHYPNVTGYPDGNDEYMPVEESGNIVIMGLAVVNSLLYDTPNAGGGHWFKEGSTRIPKGKASAFALETLETRDGINGLDDKWGGVENGKGRHQARKWINHSYTLWKQWTGYLVEDTLMPHNQLSTDDFAGWLANHTNLALKGIIGIKAMSQLAHLVDRHDDVKHFANISHVYIKKWEELAISRDGTHAKLAYTWYGSWTTIYNLYTDALLCFHSSASTSNGAQRSEPWSTPSDQNPLKPPPPGTGRDGKGFVSDRIYQIQSDWYHNVRQKYGLPLDNRHLYTKSDWGLWAASIASKKVRAEIIDGQARWVNETVTDKPMGDLHETEGDGNWGDGIQFCARPVVGGHFALLALEKACDGKAMAALRFLDHHADEDDDEKEEEKEEKGDVRVHDHVDVSAGEL